MNEIKKLGILIILIGLNSGCSSLDVLVKDTDGNPIEGAIVYGISPSMTGKGTFTNRKGVAPIPWSAQEIEWIVVEKFGYGTTDQIEVKDKQKPIEVLLKKECSNP